MQFIQTEWRILLLFNEVYVIAKTPLTNTKEDELISKLVMGKILIYLSKF